MVPPKKKPTWLVKRVPKTGKAEAVSGLLSDLSLSTVCEEAHCPNQSECFGQGTATFLLLGPDCTRNCTFCAVNHAQPAPPDSTEPERIAEAVSKMKLTYCILTMVTRDDLPNGGAGHVAATITAVRKTSPQAHMEVLVSDFNGENRALDLVLNASPDVLNHNLETVPRLYPSVRPMADYHRSIRLLKKAHGFMPRIITKSGLMLGLGETKREVLNTMDDLLSAGCNTITLGQYLAPSGLHHPVVRYVPPEEFEELKEAAISRGFIGVASGPYVRSSYHGERLFQKSNLFLKK